MKLKTYSKLIFVSFLLIISIFFSSSCGLLSRIFNTLPSIIMCSEFENDKWLMIDNLLIDKESGSVSVLKSAPYESVDQILFIYTYKVEFEENEFKIYTFCRNYSEPDKYYECVCTFDYNCQETAFDFLSEKISEDEFFSLLETRLIKEACVYSIDDYTKYIDYRSSDDTTFFEHVESIYNFEYEENNIERVRGVARPIGDELWFSVVLFPSDYSFLDNIRKSEIKSYNPTTGEFITVYEHNKNREAIIDFDANGLYTLHNNGKIIYYDMESGESNIIYSIPDNEAYLFKISDNYICTKYENGKDNWCYLVYEKHKGIVADNLFTEDDIFGYYELYE